MTTRRLLAILTFAAAATWSVSAAFASASAPKAQQPPRLPIQDGQVLPLWTGAAPAALGSDETDIPTLTVYLPRTVAANTPAVVICPGGGYQALASNHEGRQVA